MSQTLCHFLVLVFVTSITNTLGKPTGSALECGEEDKFCAILAQLVSTVNEMKNQLGKQATQLNEKLNKQARDLEELKRDLNKTFASTATISTQMGRYSTDLLSHDGRLRAHEVSQRNEYQLMQSEWTRGLGDLSVSRV